jgi:hypothetical protein
MASLPERIEQAHRRQLIVDSKRAAAPANHKACCSALNMTFRYSEFS